MGPLPPNDLPTEGSVLSQNDELPDEPGKSELLRVCTQCHPIEQIIGRRRSNQEWNEVIARMAGQGALATDKEFEIIQKYLSSNFGKTDEKRSP
jgi:quinoprotein glucose dehydrogenase